MMRSLLFLSVVTLAALAVWVFFFKPKPQHLNPAQLAQQQEQRLQELEKTIVYFGPTGADTLTFFPMQGDDFGQCLMRYCKKHELAVQAAWPGTPYLAAEVINGKARTFGGYWVVFVKKEEHAQSTRADAKGIMSDLLSDASVASGNH